MARKKYFDENNDEPCKGQLPGKQQEIKTLQPHNQQQACGFLVGGGTKNRKSHEYHHGKNFDESFASVAKQLSNLGLTIREMPGDGNCLFRALSDQITGSSRNHLEYRRSVVQYMKEFRADFEPFVEDDEPFDIYIHRLSQAGTFAGNDAIVAFARLHNVTVVIHQLNSPAWIIHPSKGSQDHSSGREVHIFYHNGDHYNSVRRTGDDSESPTNIKLHAQAASNKPSGKKSPPHSSSRTTKSSTSTSEAYSVTDYVVRDEDLWVKDTADLDRLVDEIMQKTNYPDSNLVRDTLLEYNFDMNATMDFILSMSLVMHQRGDNQNFENNGKEGDTPLIGDEGTRGQTLEASIASDESNNLVCNSKPVNDMDEQCEDVEDSEDSGMPDESDESSIAASPSEVSSSQSKGTNQASRKVTPRHKKRERKRESDLRKKRLMGVGGGEQERESTENTVVISNLGSLDI